MGLIALPRRPPHPRGRAPARLFLGTAALLCMASTAATLSWHAFASPLAALPLCGGRAVSTLWTGMPGQSWAGAATAFLAMWTVMMMAMMLPSATPALWRYRQALDGAGCRRPGQWAALAGIAYFCTWAALGAALFPLGAGWAAMHRTLPGLDSAEPLLAGGVLLIAGAVQCSAWKARHLARCRQASPHGGMPRAQAGQAWRFGLRLGRCCLCSCAGPTAMLLALGAMDARVMAAATAIITLERLAPRGHLIARASGLGIIAAGLLLLARAGAAL